jgi:hypothetical protein
MRAYLRRHETFVRGQLASTGDGADWEGLARAHRARTSDLQHERLAHLLVMLVVGIAALLTLLVLVVRPLLLLGVLLLLLLSLFAPYVVHYYRLENAVHRWYRLGDELEARAGGVAPGRDGTAGDGRAR